MSRAQRCLLCSGPAGEGRVLDIMRIVVGLLRRRLGELGFDGDAARGSVPPAVAEERVERGVISEGDCRYLRQELVDEIHKHVPMYQEYLQVLINIRDLRFPRADFDRDWASRPSLAGVAPINGLRELFEFSVVPYRRSGGGGGGSRYVFRCLDPSALFDEAASEFQVHAGFKEVLDLATRRRYPSRSGPA